MPRVKATVYYVTAVAVPKGASPAYFDAYAENPGAYARTDMAKFYSEADALDHMGGLGGAAFFDRRVEPREELVDEEHLPRPAAVDAVGERAENTPPLSAAAADEPESTKYDEEYWRDLAASEDEPS